MRKAVMLMWYVIQVLKGREDAMAELIGRVAPASACEECFSPKYATEMKVGGRWVPCKKDLFPGYIIAVTDDPAALEACLRGIDGFARVLMQGSEYVPLAADEVELIGAFTRAGRRVVPMSRGFKAGERVVITEGPLVGHEYLIKSINRHKSLAFLEVDLCGRRVATRVGLAVLSPVDAPEARVAGLYPKEALQGA